MGNINNSSKWNVANHYGRISKQSDGDAIQDFLSEEMKTQQIYLEY